MKLYTSGCGQKAAQKQDCGCGCGGNNAAPGTQFIDLTSQKARTYLIFAGLAISILAFLRK